MTRAHLPNRRPSHLETLEVAGQTFEVCVGFDPATGQPREVPEAFKQGAFLVPGEDYRGEDDYRQYRGPFGPVFSLFCPSTAPIA